MDCFRKCSHEILAPTEMKHHSARSHLLLPTKYFQGRPHTQAVCARSASCGKERILSVLQGLWGKDSAMGWSSLEVEGLH